LGGTNLNRSSINSRFASTLLDVRSEHKIDEAEDFILDDIEAYYARSSSRNIIEVTTEARAELVLRALKIQV